MSERPKRYDGSQRPYDGSPKPKPPPAPPSSQSSPPTLPPVSPEDLVEGEWYVFNYHTAFIPMIGKAEIHQGKFRLVDSFHSSKWSWANSETDIYGPLRFKIGGAS